MGVACILKIFARFVRNLSILPPPLLKSWLRPCPSAASDLYLAFSGSRFDLNIELECVDDLYLHITLNYCAHEQKAHGLQWIGVANKKKKKKRYNSVTLVDHAKRFKA